MGGAPGARLETVQGLAEAGLFWWMWKDTGVKASPTVWTYLGRWGVYSVFPVRLDLGPVVWDEVWPQARWWAAF